MSKMYQNKTLPATFICKNCGEEKEAKKFFIPNEEDVIMLSDHCNICAEFIDNFRKLYRVDREKALQYRQEFLNKQSSPKSS